MNHEFMLEVVREAMRLHIDMEANLAIGQKCRRDRERMEGEAG